MRKVALLLTALGCVGLVLGLFIVFRTAQNPATLPFSMESYGGPGPIVGALVLICGGLYLFSSARREG